MKNCLSFLFLLFLGNAAFGQCTVTSLNISTGYDPLTGGLTTAPVLDPKWTSTVSAAAATAIAGDGHTLGCYDIVPLGLWPSSGSSCNWMSAQNWWGYNTTGPGPDIFWMTLARSFNLCSSDSLVIRVNIESDDWISNMYFDGNPIYTLGSTPCGVTSFNSYTFNLGMVSAGGHTFSVEVHNCNNGVYDNAIGIALNGTVSSITGRSSIISESDTSCLSVASVSDTTICAGTPLNLHASSTGIRYYWNTGDTTSSVVATSAGTYWVEAFGGTCHLRIDSFHINGSITDTTFRRHDTSVCASSAPITLSAPVGSASRYWSTGSTASSINVSASGNYIVISSPNCTSAFIDSFVVIIDPLLNVNLGNDTSICSAYPLVLTSSQPVGTSFLWSTGNTTNTITAATSGTYWLHVNNGCVASDTIRVTVHPSPSVNLGPDIGICSYDSLKIGQAEPAGCTYLWSTGATSDSIIISAAGTYWLSVSNGFCVSTDSINLAVNPQPVVSLGPDTSNCDGASIVLTPTVSVSTVSYLWSDGSTTPTITATSVGNYWVRVALGACASADTVHVVIQFDTVALLNRDTAICKGGFVQAIAYINPAATCQWLPTAGIAVSNVRNAFITPDTSAMYYLNVYMTGCPVKTAGFLIDVQPKQTVFAGGNKLVCQFDTLHLHATVLPAWYMGYSYSWAPGSDLDHSNTPNVVYTAGASQKYIVTVTTSAGCTGIDSAVIGVFPGNFAIAPADASVCPHDSLRLAVSGGETYVWHPGLYLSDSTAADPWIKAIASQKYQVIATSSDGCRDTVNVAVNVFPGAVISMEDSATISPGETFHIQPATNCNNFLWFPPTGLDNVLVSDPSANPELSTMYKVRAITENGCMAIDSITIVVDPEALLDLPNAFAPGKDNYFSILKRGEATLNYFRVFNRWGNMVFETKDINKGWDGAYKGAAQPFDVYVYEVEAVTSAGKHFNKHGNVTLIR